MKWTKLGKFESIATDEISSLVGITPISMTNGAILTGNKVDYLSPTGMTIKVNETVTGIEIEFKDVLSAAQIDILDSLFSTRHELVKKIMDIKSQVAVNATKIAAVETSVSKITVE